MILFDVTLAARPGMAAAFEDLLRRTMVASRAEPGCRSYRFTRDLDDASVFHLIELWEDELAFAGHAGGEALAAFRRELTSLGQVTRSDAFAGPLDRFSYRRPEAKPK